LTALLAVLLLGADCDTDIVVIGDSKAGEELGVLVDGIDESGAVVNDATYVVPVGLIGVGNLTSNATGDGEVASFSNRRAVAFENDAGFTSSNSDVVTVNHAAEIAIPVTVWIVKGPFNTQKTKAIDACITTSGIWNAERMGVRFSSFTVKNATGDSDASSYFDFDCSMQAGLQSDIGEDAGRINIYYLEKVDGGTGRGNVCTIGGDFVAMAQSTGDELLSHELGHDYSLLHIDTLASFDQTNIMHSASNTRAFVTEGQLFRAHLRTNSALNSLYAARPGLPTRNCAQGTANNDCPNINKRIWADGTFPAN
jgi:hypothetical protein